MSIFARFVLAVAVWLFSLNQCHAESSTKIVAKIEALFVPGADIAQTKLAVDRFVEPTTPVDGVNHAINELVTKLQPMLSGATGAHGKLKVLQKFYYEAGPWNDYRPFAYDHSDPLGKKLSNKLLATYLTTRKGNCVSMPILFAILAQRIGLKVTLAEAPFHLFVKLTDESGKEWNLEATSGARYTRDVWYRQELPMTDKAVANGIYLRALSAEETQATLVGFLPEWYMGHQDYDRAALAAEVISRHAPRNVAAIIWRGSTAARLLQRDILSRYASMAEMPVEDQLYAQDLSQINKAAFDEAEALGWTEKDGTKQ